MKLLQRAGDGVIAGKENNNDLFIRRVTFDSGYSEKDPHNHPNSFEFYIVVEGEVVFATEDSEVTALAGSIVYFEQSEKHRIALVKQKSVLLLLKKVGSIKE